MTAYPLDFRQKIVSAYEAGNTSIRKVAERFMVTKRTVQRLIKQNRETGDLTPKKVGTKKPSPLEAHKEIIVETVEQHPDWTLWQYCEEIAEKTGVSVSTGTMCRFLEKQELTLKKRRFAVKKLLLKKCNRKGLIIGKKPLKTLSLSMSQPYGKGWSAQWQEVPRGAKPFASGLPTKVKHIV